MRKLTTEEFITKSKLAHGDKYDYSKINYTNNRAKVIIICPEHGEFEQKAHSHIDGYGCPDCGGTKKSTQAEFIILANLLHLEKYTYENFVYLHSKHKSYITCPLHGDFEQTPNNHLSGRGCYYCGQETSSLLRQKTTEEFVTAAKLIHNNTYDYSKVIYTGIMNKVILICPLHGEFEQCAQHHLNGSGCSSCMACGFDKNKPAYLYYLKIITDSNQILYKIGITNKTVNERFSLKELAKIEIVKQKLYENGQDAYDWEQKLLKLYKQYQYKGPNILRSGNTELFTEDIIALYYKENQLE